MHSPKAKDTERAGDQSKPKLPAVKLRWKVLLVSKPYADMSLHCAGDENYECDYSDPVFHCEKYNRKIMIMKYILTISTTLMELIDIK